MTIKLKHFNLTSKNAEIGDTPIMFKHTNELSFLSEGFLTVTHLDLGQANFNIYRTISTGHAVNVDDESVGTMFLSETARLGISSLTKKIEIDPSSAFYVPPLLRRTTFNPLQKQVGTAISIVFDWQTLSEELGLQKHDALILQNTGQLMPRLRTNLLSLIEDAESDRPILSTSVLGLSLAETVKNYIHEMTIANAGYRFHNRVSGSFAKVRLATEYINHNYDAPLTLNELAHEVGMSQRALQYAFENVVGCSPMTVLLEVRLDRARAALKDKDDLRSVKAIAFDCGFHHLGRFSIAYKKRFGVSPSLDRIR